LCGLEMSLTRLNMFKKISPIYNSIKRENM
jgi:hypothetical protein